MVDQREFLEDAQRELGVTQDGMAALLQTNVNTYRAWVYGRNPLAGAARVAITLLLEKHAREEE